MGSSSKKKKEKKQDFQKQKLKVGKTKPKPNNATDTSFRSKAIILNQQSLRVDAPTTTHQFSLHVSLLGARSDAQRKESLAYLTTAISTWPINTPLPQPTAKLFDKVCPLILDGSLAVRAQALKFLQTISVDDVRDHVPKILPFLRAGMTHLAKDIRMSTIDILSWLLTCAGNETVSCAGGWQRSLESFTTLLGWKLSEQSSKWSISTTSSLGQDAKSTARIMNVLEQFLQAGLSDGDPAGVNQQQVGHGNAAGLPLWHSDAHSIPTRSNAYAHLDLFGAQTDDNNQILEDRVDRLRVYRDRFRPSIQVGLNAAKQSGGEVGRATGSLTKALKQLDVS